MEMQPSPEHDWLKQLQGDWQGESEVVCEPGQAAQQFKSTETGRMLGDFWVQLSGQGEMPGGGVATMQMTLGYDPVKQAYVGTWLGSMMSHLWVYEGKLDTTGRILTLSTSGPGFTAPGKVQQYRDVIELVNARERRLNSYTLGEDGVWQQFMTARYTRKH